MTDCCMGDKYGKGLIIEFREATSNMMVDFEQEPDFDGKEEVDEEIVVGDEGLLLVVRRVCFTPRKAEGEDWRRNIIQYACIMGGMACKLVIGSGSCENVV